MQWMPAQPIDLITAEYCQPTGASIGTFATCCPAGIKIRSSPVFSREDRGAILNIVLDTKPALLDYWRQAPHGSSLRPSSVTTPARPAQAE